MYIFVVPKLTKAPGIAVATTIGATTGEILSQLDMEDYLLASRPNAA
jgi:hypothetical protein